MNILMMTNTYTPVIGGLERSVRAFSEAYRARGHQVVVVAPAFPGTPPQERGVIRVPAIQRFNGSDFSVKLPVPRPLARALLESGPDLIHAHHPFLIGSTALRLARTHRLPLVFTHHTLFEQYTHYTPVNAPVMSRFVIELSSGYANLCDQVFAPSESVATLLRERGVAAPIAVVPTGIDVERFASGEGRGVRAALGIPPRALVVGHVGRLAPEKNLRLLSQAAAAFLRRAPEAHLLLVGRGPSEEEIQHILHQAGVGSRVHHVGVLEGQRLVNAYHAMDVFFFASKSETQGLVVTEAMAAGLPVVALDASGVREVVADRRNGRLVRSESPQALAAALQWVAAQEPAARRALRHAARRSAARFSMSTCAERALGLYETVLARGVPERRRGPGSRWALAARRLKVEWRLLKNVTKATTVAVARAQGAG